MGGKCNYREKRQTTRQEEERDKFREEVKYIFNRVNRKEEEKGNRSNEEGAFFRGWGGGEEYIVIKRKGGNLVKLCWRHGMKIKKGPNGVKSGCLKKRGRNKKTLGSFQEENEGKENVTFD